ncbi:hypothetical protein FJT64_004679 [Amphibalanus amphitrite]|uniref:Uncharacterized protein n=1 Tax=Amphibalanus amphitrite TaxID=1232801 RepID=A0A6A4W4N9_AMPAM|nr:hypothetical protein FJT64_004679 [Amphibalanus amphitrite]
MSRGKVRYVVKGKDAETFCPDPVSSLHMLLHSTGITLGHSVSLTTHPAVPRHTFVDPLIRMSAPLKEADYRLMSAAAEPANSRDWPFRAAGGMALVDRYWSPHRFGHRLLVTAADPRYQAEMMLQWMGTTQPDDMDLAPGDAVLLGQTTCLDSKACPAHGQSAPCRGYRSAECRCQESVQPTIACQLPSPVATGCEPASGARRSCPYRAVVGADLQRRAHPGCSRLTAVANGLAAVHADVRRFLEAPQYPWRHFVVTILACTGWWRLSDVTVGFPAAYGSQLRGAGLPADRDQLCAALRVYITNAEAQSLGGDSRLTHETFCLDDVVLGAAAHLGRPRRPPPQPAIVTRDAVHLWLGPQPEGLDIDLSQLVVKLFAVPAGPTAVPAYSVLHELDGEQLPADQCVIEISDQNDTRTTPAATTTVSPNATFRPMNLSAATGAMTDDLTTSTGSIFGMAVLLLLLAYCMCQRTAGGGDWESDSSWSESPASWTTSSTSSWTTTPSSSADHYSTESFDFERDAQLVGGRATLQYMRRVQEEALRRRRLELSHPCTVQSD